VACDSRKNDRTKVLIGGNGKTVNGKTVNGKTVNGKT
jgi:hypothetical protein